MPAPIAILHGWSDDSESFRPLRQFLAANGYAFQSIWLGDYISLDDDVRVEDAAKRMKAVVDKLIKDGALAQPFDLIVHSTGSLVAREWLATFYPNGAGAPVKRFVMLAPANFGSKHATLGKSFLGRIFKGANNWLQTGTQMLNSLELASPYQWRLARRDLFDADGAGVSAFGPDKVWPFVIVGTRGWRDIKAIVNEDGSDGTVRAAAANMNAVGMTVDFSNNRQQPKVTLWKRP